MDSEYSNIRGVLGQLIGHKVVEVTQQDKEEWEETHQAYIALHFDNGTTLKMPVTDAGFDIEGIEVPDE